MSRSAPTQSVRTNTFSALFGPFGLMPSCPPPLRTRHDRKAVDLVR
jgi:hypothetical protein